MASQSSDSLRELVAAAAGLAAGAIVIALVFAAPWRYGGVEQSFRAWIAGALAAGLLAAALHVVTARDSSSWWATFLPVTPLLGLLALGAVQWHFGPPITPTGATGGAPLTIYPAATRLAMAALVSAVAAALIGSMIFSKRPGFELLLFGCLVSAALVAFFGIAMKLTGDDKLIRGMTFLGDPFARFVNRNNACAFICAGVAAGCGLIRGILDVRPSDSSVWNGGRQSWLPDRTTRFLVCLVLLAICLAGAFASRSRGGSIAALVTITAGLAFSSRTSWRRAGLLVFPLVLLAVALVGWVGLSGATLDRFKGLTYESMIREGRVPHWEDALRAFGARPMFGAGLGTYGYAHQEFSAQTHEYWYEHADNQYIEVLVEGGATGAAMVVVGFLMASFAVRGAGIADPAAVLIVSLISGQIAHAAFDYGIVVPATVLITSILWGAGTTSLLRRASFSPVSGVTRFGIGTFAVAAAVALVPSVREHRLADAVEQYLWSKDRTRRPGELEPGRVDQLIRGLSDALSHRPDDAVGQRTLAELYVYRFRMASLETLRRADPALSESDAWRATSLVSLHGEVNRAVAAGAVNARTNLRLVPIVQRDLVPAREHFVAAKAACPRLTDIYVPLAALAFLDPGSDLRGLEELEAARRLFPTDTGLLRTAGRMAWQAGDSDLASRCWKASLELSPARFDSITRPLIDEIGAEKTVALTVADDPATALRLINAADGFNTRLEAPLGRILEDQAQRLPAGPLRQRVEANAAWLAGRNAEADESFRSLLDANPWDIELRVNFAVACFRRGRTTEAIEQLLAAIALDPDREVLKQWVTQWQAASR